MRLKTFTAADMMHAMQMVRDALGEDAVIISTDTAKDSVTVTAAFDDVSGENGDMEHASWFDALNDNSADKAVRRTIDTPREIPLAQAEEPPEHIVLEIASLLDHHGVNKHLQHRMTDRLQELTHPYKAGKTALEQWLHALLDDIFSMAPLTLENDSCRHILIGAPGAGKTLTTAKIAAKLVKSGQHVHVISTDNKRAGGVEQLSAITDILGIDLMIAENRQSLKLMLSDIPLDQTVIVDSAGANPYDFYELKELGEYAGLIELDPVLVYPAGSDPQEADEVARAFSFIGVEKMIVTRTDAARRFGSILNAADAAGLDFANITGSEKILGTFDACTPAHLTKLLMDYRPQDV